jgi:dihydroflavonol-4-reductase
VAPPKKQTVLVTGGSGFLGLHLVETLLARGLAVRTLGRTESHRLSDLGVEQVQGSVTDSKTCGDAVEGVDQVYHLAGSVTRDESKSGNLYDVHVTGTRNILVACEQAKIEKIVVVSSSGTVGVGQSPDFLADEASKTPWMLIGKWPYYESKALAEREIDHFVKRGLPVRIARPTLLLGPGDYNGSSTGDVSKFLSGDVKAALPGGVSFVDVRDVATVLPTLMSDGIVGVGYLLGAVNFSVRDFLIGLQQVSGVRAPSFELPKSIVDRSRGLLKRVSQLSWLGGLDPVTFEMGCHYWYIDSSRAQNELGFEPRDWALTLADTVSDIRNIGRVSP